MPWEETEDKIRSGHKDSSQYDIVGQKEIAPGVSALFGKRKGADGSSEIISFIFAKKDAWTFDKAKDWFNKHSEQFVSESFQATLTVKEKKISGILAIPRISRNKVLYLPEELARGHNRTIPVYHEHDYTKEPIGQATLNWDPELWQLHYTGEVKDNSLFFSDLETMPQHVSLGADYDFEEHVDGYVIPRGVVFDEMSLVSDPGIPETTVRLLEGKGKHRILESVRVESTIENPKPPVTVTHLSQDASDMAPQHLPEAKEKKELSKQEELKETSKENPAQAQEAQPKQETPRYVTSEEFFQGLEKLTKSFTDSLSWMRPEKQENNSKKPQVPAEEKLKSTLTEEEREQKFYENLAEKLWGTPPPLSVYEASVFRFTVPRLDLPVITPTSVEDAIKERSKLLESYRAKTERINRRVTEALATSTTGASLGVYGVSPIVVVPNALIANMRDIVAWVDIARGADRARWATIKTGAAGALKQNTEPTEATQTLTSVDATPTPRGIQQSISFELEQKAVGGSMIQAIVESFRLSFLEDIDGLICTEGDTLTPAKTLYGDESVSAEASVTSAMTLAPARIASSITEINKKGYSADNLVAVLHPVQFDALLKHADVRQAHIFGEKVQVTGVIPSLYGVEVRRSTKTVTGTGAGSPAITTYHAFVAKKGVSIGIGASRDLMVETFRDIKKNQTVIKGHWDVAAKGIEPDSVVKIITA